MTGTGGPTPADGAALAFVRDPKSGVIRADVQRGERDRLVDPALPGVRLFRCRYPSRIRRFKDGGNHLEILAGCFVAIESVLADR